MNSARASFAILALAAAATAHAVVECPLDTSDGYRPDSAEVIKHRRFEIPTLRYPFGTTFTKDPSWGLRLQLHVDETGMLTCVSVESGWGIPVPLIGVRAKLLERLSHWSYEPFTVRGTVRSAIVEEDIREEELPERHRPVPHAPLHRVSISLERSGCFGSCPSYRVTVHGDGRVGYLGRSDVDVVGLHSFRVSRQDVAALVASLVEKDLWSLRSHYVAPVTDNPGYRLTIRMGKSIHVIYDYVGEEAGMPAVVTTFEKEVDDVARIDQWQHVTPATIERLQAEAYRFDSIAGADLLNHAVADEKTSDDSIFLLIDLGVPLSGGRRKAFEMAAPGDFALETAIALHRPNVVEALLSHGALNTHGTLDQTRLDAAFLTAVRAGRLDLVDQIWDAAGITARPSLTFDSKSLRTAAPPKRAPVTLALSHSYGDETPWDGLAVARWLAERGCDLRATSAGGANLLHAAAEAGDLEFVKYLLQQGVSTSARNEDAETPLEATLDDDVATALLEGGAGPSGEEESWENIRKLAQRWKWERTLAWLADHGH